MVSSHFSIASTPLGGLGDDDALWSHGLGKSPELTGKRTGIFWVIEHRIADIKPLIPKALARSGA